MNRRRFFVAVECYRQEQLGTLIRCASAFGVKAFFIVGSSTFSTHGAHGAHRRLRVIHFPRWLDLEKRLKAVYPEIEMIGVSTSWLSDHARWPRGVGIPSSSVVYKHTCCFVLPHTKHGFSDAQVSICDFFTFVQLPDQSREGKLHRNTKLSLVFQECAAQLGLRERAFGDSKFSVTEGSVLDERDEEVDLLSARKVDEEDEREFSPDADDVIFIPESLFSVEPV